MFVQNFIDFGLLNREIDSFFIFLQNFIVTLYKLLAILAFLYKTSMEFNIQKKLCTTTTWQGTRQKFWISHTFHQWTAGTVYSCAYSCKQCDFLYLIFSYLYLIFVPIPGYKYKYKNRFWVLGTVLGFGQ
jgi:hypothetical protein